MRRSLWPPWVSFLQILGEACKNLGGAALRGAMIRRCDFITAVERTRHGSRLACTASANQDRAQRACGALDLPATVALERGQPALARYDPRSSPRRGRVRASRPQEWLEPDPRLYRTGAARVARRWAHTPRYLGQRQRPHCAQRARSFGPGLARTAGHAVDSRTRSGHDAAES